MTVGGHRRFHGARLFVLTLLRLPLDALARHRDIGLTGAVVQQPGGAIQHDLGTILDLKHRVIDTANCGYAKRARQNGYMAGRAARHRTKAENLTRIE